VSCGRTWAGPASRECADGAAAMTDPRFEDEREMDELKELMEDLKNAD